MTGQHRAAHGSTGISFSGQGGRHRAEHSHSGAYVWLGTGAVTVGLGVALAGGAGVAQADTNSNNRGPTTTIRTTLSAQTVSSKSDPTSARVQTGAKPQSFVSAKDSVVRQMNPAAAGDDNPGPGPTFAEQLLGQGRGENQTIAERLLGGGDSQGSGIPGLGSGPNIPFIELGGGGGGLLSKIAGALGGGLF